jgi:hypothetical protein
MENKNGGVSIETLAEYISAINEQYREYLHTPEGMELMRQMENRVKENKRKTWWKFWKK